MICSICASSDIHIREQRHSVSGRLSITQWTCRGCDHIWFKREPEEGSPADLEAKKTDLAAATACAKPGDDI